MALFNTNPRGRLPSAASRPVRRRGVPSRRRGVTERTSWGRGDSQRGSPLCFPLLPRRAAASGIPERVFMWQQMGAARFEQHRGARTGAAPSVCVPAPHPGARSGLTAPMGSDGAARSSLALTKHSPKREPQFCVGQLQPGAESRQTSREGESRAASPRLSLPIRAHIYHGERKTQPPGPPGANGSKAQGYAGPSGAAWSTGVYREVIFSLFPQLPHSVCLSIIWICIAEIQYLRGGRSQRKGAKGSSPAPASPPHLYFDSLRGV